MNKEEQIVKELRKLNAGLICLCKVIASSSSSHSNYMEATRAIRQLEIAGDEDGSLLPDLEEYEMFNDGWGDQ